MPGKGAQPAGRAGHRDRQPRAVQPPPGQGWAGSLLPRQPDTALTAGDRRTAWRMAPEHLGSGDGGPAAGGAGDARRRLHLLWRDAAAGRVVLCRGKPGGSRREPPCHGHKPRRSSSCDDEDRARLRCRGRRATSRSSTAGSQLQLQAAGSAPSVLPALDGLWEFTAEDANALVLDGWLAAVEEGGCIPRPLCRTRRRDRGLAADADRRLVVPTSGGAGRSRILCLSGSAAASWWRTSRGNWT